MALVTTLKEILGGNSSSSSDQSASVTVSGYNPNLTTSSSSSVVIHWRVNGQSIPRKDNAQRLSDI